MLKKIVPCISTLLFFSNLSAQDCSTSHLPIISTYSSEDAEAAYHYRDDCTQRIGHLLKFSFPSLNQALKLDTQVWDPQDPAKKVDVAAVIDGVRWDGAPNDPIEFSIRVSFQNKAILQEAFASLPENGEIEAEWVVYDYDHQDEKYFKRFYTYKKPIKFVITEDSKIYLDERPDYRVKKPTNFELSISLTPKSGIDDQHLYFAFRNGACFSRQVGGPQKKNLTHL